MGGREGGGAGGGKNNNQQRHSDRGWKERGGCVQKVGKFIIFKLYITLGSAVVSGILQAFYIRAKIMLYNWQEVRPRFANVAK